MAKASRPTRSELRQRRAAVPVAGPYGVDVLDAGAQSWTGRYLVWADGPDEARQRLAAAGFRQRQVTARWTPRSLPPDGVPDDLRPGVTAWFGSRLHDDGWSPWHRLPEDYQHPPQGAAAQDPGLRHRHW